MSAQHPIFAAALFFAASITQPCPTVATTTSSSVQRDTAGFFSVGHDAT
eukprot:CAMPEP_0194295920 /NCGR_PEP_ID=MMETSP0169-20130528/54717_1 /TAXON_ID=218684 /ORGANISM="Corethron pennatum, Strain L29A3" /LENGTH=48 /DNA_ID= /DNA_START= /DNA_END= /DNA_ORIENTATION=